jgi:hypothetical protein
LPWLAVARSGLPWLARFEQLFYCFFSTGQKYLRPGARKKKDVLWLVVVVVIIFFIG